MLNSAATNIAIRTTHFLKNEYNLCSQDIVTTGSSASKKLGLLHPEDMPKDADKLILNPTKFRDICSQHPHNIKFTNGYNGITVQLPASETGLDIDIDLTQEWPINAYHTSGIMRNVITVKDEQFMSPAHCIATMKELESQNPKYTPRLEHLAHIGKLQR